MRAIPVSASLAVLVGVTAVPRSAGAECARKLEGHYRPLVLADYVGKLFASPDWAGMVLTLPLGFQVDPWECTTSGTASWKVLSFGLYGPGLNWVGAAHLKPAYPSVLIAWRQDVVDFQLALGKETDAERPAELLFGAGTAFVVTGEAFNYPPGLGNRLDGMSFGFFVGASLTPAEAKPPP